MRTTRRDAIGLLAGAMAGGTLLAGCGGGGTDAPGAPAGPQIGEFTSDRAAYFVGDRARLTAVYSGGTGRIEPGSIPIASGQTVETPVLSERKNFRLIVADGARTAFRDRMLDVTYRERTRTIAAPFARAEHQSVILGDGSVLIVGGADDGVVMPPSVWRFDPTNETFAEFTQLATGRVGHVAVALADDRVLVYGGGRALTAAPVAEIIDTRTRTARATAFAPVAPTRSYAAAVLLGDGRVLIVGGASLAGAQPVAELFDPQTERFTAVPGGLGAARYGHTATRLRDGRVLVYGGLGPLAAAGPVAPPEIYDPATSRFTTLPAPENYPRMNHAAVGMADGSVWILGGESLDGGPLPSVLRFDPATGTFTRVQDLLAGRTYARALLLTDERVLAAGGDTAESGIASDTTELLATNGIRRAGPVLGRARALHSVTPLITTGRVLLVGGLGPNREVLATAEIFE
jgi:hypothetical protein